MKKLFFIFGAVVVAFIMTASTTAQNSKDITVNYPSIGKIDYAAIPNSPVTAINQKAVRHFRETFGEVAGTLWSQFNKGFFAYFKSNSIANRIFYDQNGNWVLSIRYYDESNLPADTRTTVKSKYFDYSIQTVEEIRLADKTIFMVDIQDKNSRKTVKVCDGEMEIINDFQN